MSRILKDLRTNFMYWRFRYITRNRLRLQSAWYRRRQPRPGARPFRPGAGAFRPGGDMFRERGTAQYVVRRTARRTWIVLLIMVALMTAIRYAGDNGYVASGLVYPLQSLVVILSIYYCLRAA